MKKTLCVIFLLISALPIFGQIKMTSAPVKTGAELEALKEAREAFDNFDFTKLAINENNLTRQAIEELRANFLPAVRPYVIDDGAYVRRLEQIAEPVFLFHRSRKSRTVVFKHRLPTVLTWKETFVTFSTGAMDILTDDEIAALIAHEIGHLYFAEKLAKARNDKDDRSARVIELECDLAALLTLSELHIKPENLISAVKKLIEARRRMLVESFEAGSPTFESRREILKLYLSVKKPKKAGLKKRKSRLI